MPYLSNLWWEIEMVISVSSAICCVAGCVAPWQHESPCKFNTCSSEFATVTIRCGTALRRLTRCICQCHNYEKTGSGPCQSSYTVPDRVPYYLCNRHAILTLTNTWPTQAVASVVLHSSVAHYSRLPCISVKCFKVKQQASCLKHARMSVIILQSVTLYSHIHTATWMCFRCDCRPSSVSGCQS